MEGDGFVDGEVDDVIDEELCVVRVVRDEPVQVLQMRTVQVPVSVARFYDVQLGGATVGVHSEAVENLQELIRLLLQ